MNQFEERARQKAESREADQKALRDGKPPEELRQENSHFARLNVKLVKGPRFPMGIASSKQQYIDEINHRLACMGFTQVEPRYDLHWRASKILNFDCGVAATEFGNRYWTELLKIESELRSIGLMRTKHKYREAGSALIIYVTARGDPDCIIP